SLETGLGPGCMLSKGVINKPAAGVLILHFIGRADIGLVDEKDNDRGVVTIRCVSQHFRRNFDAGGERGGSHLWRGIALLILLWALGDGRCSRGHAKPD